MVGMVLVASILVSPGKRCQGEEAAAFKPPFLLGQSVLETGLPAICTGCRITAIGTYIPVPCKMPGQNAPFLVK